jgi:hypothetical protein
MARASPAHRRVRPPVRASTWLWIGAGLGLGVRLLGSDHVSFRAAGATLLLWLVPWTFGVILVACRRGFGSLMAASVTFFFLVLALLRLVYLAGDPQERLPLPTSDLPEAPSGAPMAPSVGEDHPPGRIR